MCIKPRRAGQRKYKTHIKYITCLIFSLKPWNITHISVASKPWDTCKSHSCSLLPQKHVISHLLECWQQLFLTTSIPKLYITVLYLSFIPVNFSWVKCTRFSSCHNRDFRKCPSDFWRFLTIKRTSEWCWKCPKMFQRPKSTSKLFKGRQF